MFGRGLGGAAGGTTAAIGGRVSDDWENRQFNESPTRVQLFPLRVMLGSELEHVFINYLHTA
jgi:hypothetical protein